MKKLLKRFIPAPVRAALRRGQLGLFHAALPLRRVSDFGQLRRLTPISSDFGRSRGTPIDRCYIEAFLSQHRRDIRGRVLEVQAATYTTKFGADVDRSDIVDLCNDNPNATIVANLAEAASLPATTFDCILCTQTLLLIYDVRAAIANMYQALKPGGVVLCTVPGVAHKLASCEPSGDFWRFTSHSARRLFAEPFGDAHVTVSTFGNVFAATAFLHGLACEELSRDELDFHDPDFEVTIGVRAAKALR